jgi:hypothetical protein
MLAAVPCSRQGNAEFQNPGATPRPGDSTETTTPRLHRPVGIAPFARSTARPGTRPSRLPAGCQNEFLGVREPADHRPLAVAAFDKHRSVLRQRTRSLTRATMLPVMLLSHSGAGESVANGSGSGDRADDDRSCAGRRGGGAHSGDPRDSEGRRTARQHVVGAASVRVAVAVSCQRPPRRRSYRRAPNDTPERRHPHPRGSDRTAPTRVRRSRSRAASVLFEGFDRG